MDVQHAYLGMVLAAFTAFMLVLAYGALASNLANLKEGRPKAPTQP